jgi:hypothetical protein
MKNGICICVAMAIVVSVDLAAQSTTSPTETRAVSTSPNAVSVTGCVQKAQPSTTPVTGTATGDTSPRFVLTNVMPSGASSATGTSGAAGGSRAASNRTYPIDADESRLSPHVGHQVEINGTFESSNPAPGVAGAPKLKVDSLRMLASSCSQ